ncbi:E6A protein [Equid gammaherpesvirus 2]|nr:E6A protein [Equid gammaherpesvirus 2]
MRNKFYFYGLFGGLIVLLWMQNMSGTAPPAPPPDYDPQDLLKGKATTPTCASKAHDLGNTDKRETLPTKPACTCKLFDANFSCMSSFSCVGHSWGCSCCCFKLCKNLTIFFP